MGSILREVAVAGTRTSIEAIAAIDTGSPETMIDSKLAEKIGRKRGKYRCVEGIGGGKICGWEIDVNIAMLYTDQKGWIKALEVDNLKQVASTSASLLIGTDYAQERGYEMIVGFEKGFVPGTRLPEGRLVWRRITG